MSSSPWIPGLCPRCRVCRTADAKFQVPVLTVTGGKDDSTKLAGFEDDAGSGSTMERFVPDLKMASSCRSM
nr:unnamed protein product [Digitaria exilis]